MKSTDNQSQKLYYTMGEVAEMMDVSQSLLRFWEKEFDEIRPKRNKKGNRLFSEQDLKTIKTIYHLVKERGLKIAAAKRQLKLGEQPHSREAAIVEKLHSIRVILMEVKQSLDDDTATYNDEDAGVGEVSVQAMAVAEPTIEDEAKVEIEQAVEVKAEVDVEVTNEVKPSVEVADNENSDNVGEETQPSNDNPKTEQKEKAKTKKSTTPRKPRRRKYVFREADLFSLDELDAMQPKPGELRSYGEVQQTLFGEE